MPTKASVRDIEKAKPNIKKTNRNVSVCTKSSGKALPYFILDVRFMDAYQIKRVGDE
jgi:hypothetical protein